MRSAFHRDCVKDSKTSLPIVEIGNPLHTLIERVAYDGRLRAETRCPCESFRFSSLTSS